MVKRIDSSKGQSLPVCLSSQASNMADVARQGSAEDLVAVSRNKSIHSPRWYSVLEEGGD